MIIGAKERFAVEWELEREHCGGLLLGKICYWVSNFKIGDYELGTSLSDVLVSLKYTFGDCGNRHSTRFCSIDATNAFYLIHNGLFESDLSLAQVVEDESWARFDISLPVDVFDGYRMYLFDCMNRSRLLIGFRPANTDHYVFQLEQLLLNGEFDDVIRSFQRALDAL